MGRALYVGINKYENEGDRLSLCVKDVELAQQVFSKRGFEKTTVLTDGQATRLNIMRELFELVTCGDSNLLFFYSGHGSKVADWSGDEKDGFDEALVPVDFRSCGMILDDHLRALMVLLPSTSKLMVVLDSCHSGTGMDLAYNLWERGDKKQMILDSGYKPSKANIFMISGCQDSQTSQEAARIGNGALTDAFFKTLNQYQPGKATWLQLIEGTRKIISDGGFAQKPNFSSGRNVSLNSRVFF